MYIYVYCIHMQIRHRNTHTHTHTHTHRLFPFHRLCPSGSAQWARGLFGGSKPRFEGGLYVCCVASLVLLCWFFFGLVLYYMIYMYYVVHVVVYFIFFNWIWCPQKYHLAQLQGAPFSTVVAYDARCIVRHGSPRPLLASRWGSPSFGIQNDVDKRWRTREKSVWIDEFRETPWNPRRKDIALIVFCLRTPTMETALKELMTDVVVFLEWKTRSP